MGMFSSLAGYAARNATKSKPFTVRRKVDGEGVLVMKYTTHEPTEFTDESYREAAEAGGFVVDAKGEGTKSGLEGAKGGMVLRPAAAVRFIDGIISGKGVPEDEPSAEPPGKSNGELLAEPAAAGNRLADHAGKNGRKAK